MEWEYSTNSVLVIGSGVSGPVVAIHLRQNGWNPILFDKVITPSDAHGGVLGIGPNGFKALHKVGLAQKVLDNSGQLNTIVNRQSDGNILSSSNCFSEFSERYGWPQVCIARAQLHRVLVDAARELSIPIHFGKCLSHIDDDANSGHITAHFDDGTQYKGAFLVGCDGLYSRTRTLLFGETKPSYTGITTTVGISPRPPPHKPSFPVGEMTNIWGNGAFMVYMTFSPTHVGWFAMTPEPESLENWKAITRTELDDFLRVSPFSGWSEPIPTAVATEERVFRLGIYDRPPLDKWYKGRCVLVGDAAHPTSPHLGQGANQALEDCVTLGSYLNEFVQPTAVATSSLEEAFVAYQNARMLPTTEIVQDSRKLGELRACKDEQQCKDRDKHISHMFDDESELWKRRDKIYS